MSKLKPKILAFFPAYNEQGKIGNAVSRVPRDIVSQILVFNDGSTDQTKYEAEQQGAVVISNSTPQGVGNAIRMGINYATEHNFDIMVILAGNNKDDPTEIPRLVEPIINEGFDFVQGSRYLKGGLYGGDMPRYRLLATSIIHPKLLSLITNTKITDSTNGFRAFKLSILNDKRMDIYQPWLDKYELEVYLFYKVIDLGYKFKEVPVSKIYPPKALGYTKMKPVTGWWSILRPLFFLGLGIKK